MAANPGSVSEYLTPQDVESKTFTPVRLREGYDMAEVDQFLDEVAASLTVLIDRADRAPQPSGSTSADGAGQSRAAGSTITSGPAVPQAAAEPVGDTVGRVGDAPLLTTSQATTAAIRVLQLAEEEAARTRSAADDEVRRRLAEAAGEVDRLRAEGQRLEAEARRVENENRARAAAAEGEIAAHRTRALAGVEADRASLAGEVERLRAYEADYRARLRSWLRAQLDHLDGAGVDGGPSGNGSADSARLAALLDGDDSRT